MPITMNSVQLNIVAMVDPRKAVIDGSLAGALFMVDNSVGVEGGPVRGWGTSQLSTTCTRGQVINWSIYSVAGIGTARISSIRFPGQPVCSYLQPYGAPIYQYGSPPAYDYWAGVVSPATAEGQYNYELQIQIGAAFLIVESPALNVVAL